MHALADFIRFSAAESATENSVESAGADEALNIKLINLVINKSINICLYSVPPTAVRRSGPVRTAIWNDFQPRSIDLRCYGNSAY